MTKILRVDVPCKFCIRDEHANRFLEVDPLQRSHDGWDHGQKCQRGEADEIRKTIFV